MANIIDDEEVPEGFDADLPSREALLYELDTTDSQASAYEARRNLMFLRTVTDLDRTIEDAAEAGRKLERAALIFSGALVFFTAVQVAIAIAAVM